MSEDKEPLLQAQELENVEELDDTPPMPTFGAKGGLPSSSEAENTPLLKAPADLGALKPLGNPAALGALKPPTALGALSDITPKGTTPDEMPSIDDIPTVEDTVDEPNTQSEMKPEELDATPMKKEDLEDLPSLPEANSTAVGPSGNVPTLPIDSTGKPHRRKRTSSNVSSASTPRATPRTPSESSEIGSLGKPNLSSQNPHCMKLADLKQWIRDARAKGGQAEVTTAIARLPKRLQDHVLNAAFPPEKMAKASAKLHAMPMAELVAMASKKKTLGDFLVLNPRVRRHVLVESGREVNGKLLRTPRETPSEAATKAATTAEPMAPSEPLVTPRSPSPGSPLPSPDVDNGRVEMYHPLPSAQPHPRETLHQMSLPEIVMHCQHVVDPAKIDEILLLLPKRLRNQVHRMVFPKLFKKAQLSSGECPGQPGGNRLHAMSMSQLRAFGARLEPEEVMPFLMNLNPRVRRFLVGSCEALRLKVQETMSEGPGAHGDLKRAARSLKRKNVHIPTCWGEAGLRAFEQAKELPTFDAEAVKGRALNLHISNTDALPSDPALMHPVLRVHVVNSKTGRYLRKPLAEDSVVTYYDGEERAEDAEGQGLPVDHIIPLQTQPTTVRGKRTVTPLWNEDLTFNAEVGYFVHPDVLFLFELLDFGPHIKSNKLHIDGWYRVAWGFCRTFGTDHQTRLKKVYLGQLLHTRLQLFQYNIGTYQGDLLIPEVYQLWCVEKHLRVKYPATLYVAFDAAPMPDERAVTRYGVSDQMITVPTEHEVGSTTFEEMLSLGGKEVVEVEDEEELDAAGRRHRGVLEACVVPTTPFRALEAGTKGCLALCFSHSASSGHTGQGGVLAAACCGRERHLINIYEVNTARLIFTYSCHLGLVYDISFSSDDCMLVTASADGTAKVWDCQWLHRTTLELPEKDSAYATLAHSSYVYTAKFHPTSRKPKYLVVTGGFDKVVRLWEMRGEDSKVLRKLSGHSSHINSVLCSPDGVRVYTAGGTGQVIVWRFNDITSPAESVDTDSSGKVKERVASDLKDDIGDYAITSLRMHPMGKFVLVHGRDNKLRAIEAAEPYHVVTSYAGLTSFQHPVKSIFSPDGRFVVSGSEDGKVYVWNAKTAALELSAQDKFPVLACPVYDVAWHPSQHMFAMCAYGRGQRIFIYVHEQDPSEAVPLELDEIDQKRIPKGKRHVKTKDGAQLNDETAEAFYNEYMEKIYMESEAMFGLKWQDQNFQSPDDEDD